MSINKRGFALLLGVGTSFLLILAGVVLALVYVFLSNKDNYYLSPYFTVVFLVSVFCGGYTAGKKGGIRSWVPAGMIGLITGGMVLLLFYSTASFIPGLTELLTLILLPAFVSSTGALLGANRGRRQQHLNRNKLTG
jgi:putative membrane protein (TIGR04086 family)